MAHLYGLAENSNDTKTGLDIMIKRFYGGPKFLVMMIPFAKLDAIFLYEKVIIIVKLIKHFNGQLWFYMLVYF